jgi:hypothetical protein
MRRSLTFADPNGHPSLGLSQHYPLYRSRPLSIWRDEPNPRKVRAKPSDISREEGEFRNLRVGADEKVRQRRTPRPASLAILEVCATCRKCGLAWQCKPSEGSTIDCLLEGRFGRKSDAEFRIDDSVDRNGPGPQTRIKRSRRPSKPHFVSGPDIDQDV